MGGSSTDFRVGTASWTDKTLLESGYYPRDRKTAEARLRFYAEHFDTVEVDSSYYALPSERNAALWADRTPDDFRFNVKAFAWLTQHEAEARALPPALRALLPAGEARQRKARAPSPEALGLAFELFHSALEPLRREGKLGCLLFQFPPWFVASAANRDYILECKQRCAGDRLAIEFRHASWLRDDLAATVTLLEEHALTFVGIDAPQAPSIPPPVWRVTTDVAYVRFHGRNRDTWFKHSGTAAERFRYLYSDRELEESADRLRRLRGAKTAYVLFNNCYGDYGVRNAETMRRLLR